MYTNSQHFVAVQSIFGTGYIPDLHSKEPNLPVDGEPWLADFVKSVGSLICGEARQIEN